jgi:hypothetical protein
MSEQITMLLSPEKHASLTVALPWLRESLPAQRMVLMFTLEPPNELATLTLFPARRCMGVSSVGSRHL